MRCYIIIFILFVCIYRKGGYNYFYCIRMYTGKEDKINTKTKYKVLVINHNRHKVYNLR